MPLLNCQVRSDPLLLDSEQHKDNFCCLIQNMLGDEVGMLEQILSVFHIEIHHYLFFAILVVAFASTIGVHYFRKNKMA